MGPWLINTGESTRQSWVDSGLPCWQLLLALVVLVALGHLVVLLAEVAGPAVGLGVLAVELAVAAGLLHPVVVAGPGWLVVEVAAGVAAGWLCLLLAWLLLLLLVLVLLQLVAWLLWQLLWLQCLWLLLLLLLLVWLMLHAVSVLSLCQFAIGFGPCSS